MHPIHSSNTRAKHPEVAKADIQLTRINPFGVKMDGKPEDVAAQLKKMHATA